jgi:hypothetical protein
MDRISRIGKEFTGIEGIRGWKKNFFFISAIRG